MSDYIFFKKNNAFSVKERVEMERTYIYKNAIIRIKLSDGCNQNIRKATEKFLHKVIFEKENRNNGNCYTS